MPNFVFPMKNADQSWDLEGCEYQSCLSPSCHCGSGTKNCHEGVGNMLARTVACAVFFCTSQLSAVNEQKIKSIKSTPGFVLIKTCCTVQLRIMPRESCPEPVWIVLIYVLVWFGSWIMLLTRGWVQEPAVLQVLPTSVWDTDDNTIEAKITTLKFDPRFTQDPSQPHQCHALE